MLVIETDPIGKGLEREAFVHPDDPGKVVKISINEHGYTRQHERELKTFSSLKKRKGLDWTHIPDFFGEVETSKGKGLVFELIRDFDGEISKTLEFYIQKEGLDAYVDRIRDLKHYFYQQKIIFNYDLKPDNVLVKKITPAESVLVVIDGIGDMVFFSFLNHFKWQRDQKITRRWKRFEKKWLGGREI